MLSYDLHIHSIRSLCGTMTLGEIVQTARQKGLRGLAVTDHGLAMQVPSFYFHVLLKRFPDEVDGVRVYKGIELNILDGLGTVDIPPGLLPMFDYIAVSHHPDGKLWKDHGARRNTDVMLATLERNPWIDAIGHPTQRSHPVEFDRLLPVMARMGVAFEVNETNHLYRKADPKQTADVLAQAVAHGVPLVTNSDAHVFHEIGEDREIQRIFDMAGVDRALAVNGAEESLTLFLNERRKRRLEAMEKEA